jgi:hypothetical protein
LEFKTDLTQIEQALQDVYNKTKDDLKDLNTRKEAEIKKLNLEAFVNEKELKIKQKQILEMFNSLLIDRF